jgi:hypothetical protein
MAISQFPPASSGGGLSNDFILNKNNTTNNTFQLPREFEAGGYAITTNTNDSTFDVYLINAVGSSVGYSNSSAIVATEPFDTVVAYGLATAATMQFNYSGPSTNATAVNNETGASPFLTSIFPADLPNIDDTATVAGGNFGTAVQITFESGTVVLAAKNVVVGSSTALVVTRPDNLIQDNAPYNLRAVNPGITQPTGSNVNILTGTVTAGADPTFITPALITGASSGVAFSTSILVSDSDGTVVNWAITAGTIPPGLSLATATGAISGTPSANGDYYFTVRITDDGQNTNSREFNLPVGFIFSGAANSTVVGGTTYAWWTTAGSATYKNASSKAVEYIVVAGGGGGGSRTDTFGVGGGGGAGGLLFGTATLSGAGTVTTTIGAGGNPAGNGNQSILSGIATATGGGGGGSTGGNGSAGGSGGGGAGSPQTGGTGTSGQGNNGGNGSGTFAAGGGGGAGENGSTDGGGAGGDGRQFGAWASAINIIYQNGFFAGGGAGGVEAQNPAPGDGGGGSAANVGNAQAGAVNSGGGGGGGNRNVGPAGGNGGSGLVVVRFT